MTKLRQLISNFGDKYAKYRIRSGRGAVYLSEIEGLKNALSTSGVLILLINEYFNWLAPLWVIFALWLFQKTFEYFAGLYDELRLGWWQKENRFKYMVDPFMQELMEKTKTNEETLKRIEEKLNK